MKVRLGKKEYQHNPLTLMMARFVQPEIRVPSMFDFDKGRIPFPLRMMGNDTWGNCVIIGQTNHLLRLERIEQRRTLRITDQEVVGRYKNLTGAQKPGDEHDHGLVILDAMRDWKNNGYPYKGKPYRISAYGELEPTDRNQLRMAIYALHGIHLGFWLPLAAQHMRTVWDYNGETGPEWKPGSWGGHLVFSKAYTPTHIEILTWGKKVSVSDAFIGKYADEAWAVVDNFDSWRAKQTIDIPSLLRQLSEISVKVNR